MVDKDIDNLVEELKNKMNIKTNNDKLNSITNNVIIKTNTNEFSVNDYPLSKKHFEKIKTSTEKSLSNITLKNIKNNEINKQDISISSKTLLIQSQIAASDNKLQLAKNLKRASEMVNIPDDEIIKIYDMLRPNRSSETDLLNIANKFESEYNALDTANLIRQACYVYKKRGVLI